MLRKLSSDKLKVFFFVETVVMHNVYFIGTPSIHCPASIHPQAVLCKHPFFKLQTNCRLHNYINFCIETDYWVDMVINPLSSGCAV